MKKSLRIALSVVIILVVVGCVFWYNSCHYIGRTAAVAAAVADAGIAPEQAYDTDVDLKVGHGPARYDVEFSAAGAEYEYVVNAVTGEILSGGVETH